MVILHIGKIENNPASGVAVVVPKHVANQSLLETVALLNLEKYEPKDASAKYDTYYINDYHGKVHNLPEPYNHPDLVVFHEIYRPKFVQISSQLRKNSIPYIIVPHCSLMVVAQNKKRLKKSVGNLVLFNKFINNALAIQYLSEYERINSNDRKPLSIVAGNGVDIPMTQKRTFSQSGAKLIYIGRLDVYQKGLDTLIKAVGTAKEGMRANKISLTICGPNEARGSSKLSRLITDYGVHDLVKIEGPTFGKQKEAKLLDSDCFVQLSRNEGQPLALLEAMSLGLPCLITPGTTLFEASTKYNLGFTVNRDVNEIAKTIVSISNKKPLLAQYSVNSVNYIRSNHDWASTSKMTLIKYTNCIATRSKE